MSSRLSGFRRDSVGIDQILNSPGMRTATRRAADTVAANVMLRHDAGGGDVDVMEYQTVGMRSDRPAALVAIRDPRGRYWQATEGILTRAASAAGLEVNER